MSNKASRLLKLILLGATLIFSSLFGYLWLASDASILFDKADFSAVPHQIFKDRNGKMLMFPLDEKYERCIWVPLSKIPEPLKNAFISAEDAKFYKHPGYDLLAIIRAFTDNLRNGRVVSGASTISQQLIRIMYPAKRTYPNKLREIAQSARMEKALSKEEILEQYLNRAPMGEQLRGVEAASIRYFAKHCDQLSIAESALLASLPKAPTYLNPYKGNKKRLLERKDWVLRKMKALGYITETEYKNAIARPINFSAEPFPSSANHFINMLTSLNPSLQGDIIATIDLDIQNSVEDVLGSHKYKLLKQGATQASAVVVSNKTMEVLALVGSLEFSENNKGYNNGATAMRSAGSTLKPFLYALSFEKGYNPATIIPDTEQTYSSPDGGYLPANFDQHFYGPVTIRTALGNSLNISAVKMINLLGGEEFYRFLKKFSIITDTSKAASHYGLGLAVGSLEVSLVSLVESYATFANKGEFRALKYLKNKYETPAERVISPEVAYMITDILSDPNSRSITFDNQDMYNIPYKLAMKTGTSTHYRDCWSIAYTADYTVGVWVGNFDGSPTYKLGGVSGAFPILKDIFNLLHKNGNALDFEKPLQIARRKICSQSGLNPNPSCANVKEEIFIRGAEPTETCAQHNSNDNFRSLPPEYAKWLYDKREKGIEGSFRLANYSANLDEVFVETRDVQTGKKMPPAIKINGNEGDETLSENSAPTEKKLYTIGSKEVASPAPLNSHNAPKILYPLSDDKFVIGSENQADSIFMQAQSNAPVEYITWVIDGVEYAKTAPPFILYWQPEKGSHCVSALNPAGLGSSVDFSVE